MPEKTYKAKGQVYTIPDKEVSSFLKDFPDAVEIQSFVKGKDTFDIPVNEVNDFIKEVPDAKPLKKKDGGTSLFGSGAYDNLPKEKPAPLPTPRKQQDKFLTQSPLSPVSGFSQTNKVAPKSKKVEPLMNLDNAMQPVEAKKSYDPVNVAQDIKIGKTEGKAALSGLASVVSSTLKSVGIAAKRLDFFNEYDGKKVEELATYKAGQWIDDKVKDLAGELSPEEQEQFSVKLAQAAGQMGGFVLGGWGGRALKMSPIVTTATLGAAAGGASEYEAAIQAGATDDQAAKAFWINAGLGTSEVLPIMSVFRKLDKYTGGLATGVLAKKISSTAGGRVTSDIMTGMFFETVQEVSVQALSNVAASNIYDATRKIHDGLLETAAISFVIGGSMNGIAASIRERRKAGGLTKEEDSQLAATQEFAERKAEEALNPDNQEITTDTNENPKVKEIIKAKIDLEADLATSNLPDETKATMQSEIAVLDEKLGAAKTEVYQQELDSKTAVTLQETIAKNEALLSDDKLADGTKSLIQKQIDADKEKLSQISPAELPSEIKPIEVGQDGSVSSKGEEKVKQQELENKVDEINRKRTALRGEDGAVPNDKMGEWNSLGKELNEAKRAASRGNSKGSIVIKKKSDNETSAPTHLSKDEKQEAADLIEQVIQGSKTVDEAVRRVQKLGYVFDLANADLFARYVKDRLSDAPQVGNNKSSFQDWVNGKQPTQEVTDKASQSPTEQTSKIDEVGNEVVDEGEIERQMQPITDEMVKVEGKFANSGYKIRTDYDNEIIVVDKKTNEIIAPEELPDNLKKAAADYELAVSKLGEFDSASMERSLAKSRGIEVEAEVVGNAALPPTQTNTKSNEDVGEKGKTEAELPEQQKLEKERDEKITKEAKPEVKLDFLKAEEIVNSKDPVVNKEKYREIVDRYKTVKSLIDCLWT